jgi:hypothetical protein
MVRRIGVAANSPSPWASVRDVAHRGWQKAGLKPHRLERYMACPDPDFETKAADNIRPLLEPTPARRDLLRRRKDRHPRPRPARFHFSVLAGTVRHTSQDFVAFLDEVVAQCPARQQIHVILDNLSAYSANAKSIQWKYSNPQTPNPQ